jgi:hypothetical protein
MIKQENQQISNLNFSCCLLVFQANARDQTSKPANP